ncbi:hypothetical protein B0H14DRAFT_3490279 [Mycena olivaceomarginata]|nr:hypothetical protein B0H14DRAFT_3490279 [Mycena olivaceomarginata]
MAPGSPTLPRELEREIFELCALSRPAFIPKLMLVAQRVKEWLKTAAVVFGDCLMRFVGLSLCVYRTMILGFPKQITDLPLFSDDIISSLRRPPTFFHTVVRYLILFPSSDMKAMLTLCTNVEDLWLYDLKPALIPLIGALPLKRLRVSAARMPLPPSRIFSHLTHLHLGGNRNSAEDTCAFIASLPKLTICRWAPTPRRRWELPQDVRFVVMRPRDKIDWYAGIQRGTDYWSDAETFVEKRRRGELDSRNYFWEPPS